MERNSLMILFRFSSICYRKKIPIIPKFITIIIRILYSCELLPGTQIGRNTLFMHNALGCVVHPKAIIGDNCKIYQNVSIAGRNNLGTPIIGNNVLIGAGACILGNVKIGNNVRIGSNAVILKDVPDNATVVGIPGVIKKYDK